MLISVYVIILGGVVFYATRHFQQYIIDIVTVNLIGGGSTRRKPPTCRIELTTLVVIGTDCTGNRLFQLKSANIPILFTNPSYFNFDGLFLPYVKI